MWRFLVAVAVVAERVVGSSSSDLVRLLGAGVACATARYRVALQIGDAVGHGHVLRLVERERGLDLVAVREHLTRIILKVAAHIAVHLSDIEVVAGVLTVALLLVERFDQRLAPQQFPLDGLVVVNGVGRNVSVASVREVVVARPLLENLTRVRRPLLLDHARPEIA